MNRALARADGTGTLWLDGAAHGPEVSVSEHDRQEALRVLLLLAGQAAHRAGAALPVTTLADDGAIEAHFVVQPDGTHFTMAPFVPLRPNVDAKLAPSLKPNRPRRFTTVFVLLTLTGVGLAGVGLTTLAGDRGAPERGTVEQSRSLTHARPAAPSETPAGGNAGGLIDAHAVSTTPGQLTIHVVSSGSPGTLVLVVVHGLTTITRHPRPTTGVGRYVAQFPRLEPGRWSWEVRARYAVGVRGSVLVTAPAPPRRVATSVPPSPPRPAAIPSSTPAPTRPPPRPSGQPTPGPASAPPSQPASSPVPSPKPPPISRPPSQPTDPDSGPPPTPHGRVDPGGPR